MFLISEHIHNKHVLMFLLQLYMCIMDEKLFKSIQIIDVEKPKFDKTIFTKNIPYNHSICSIHIVLDKITINKFHYHYK